MKKAKPQWKSIVDLFVFPQFRNFRNISNAGRKKYRGGGVSIFLLLFLKYTANNPRIFWYRIF